MGQLDLQAGFGRAGTRRKDIENQFAAVQHLDARGLLQIAHLARREVDIEHDHVGVSEFDRLDDLLDFSLADVGAGVDVVSLLRDLADDDSPGRFGQAADFIAWIGGSQGRCGRATLTRTARSARHRKLVAGLVER